MSIQREIVKKLKKDLNSLTVRELLEREPHFKVSEFNTNYHLNDKMVSFIHYSTINGYTIEADSPLGEAIKFFWHFDYAEELLVNTSLDLREGFAMTSQRWEEGVYTPLMW